jgi:hypothetical protein
MGEKIRLWNTTVQMRKLIVSTPTNIQNRKPAAVKSRRQQAGAGSAGS